MTYLILEWTGAELIASRFLQRRGEFVLQGRERHPAGGEHGFGEALRNLSPAGDPCRIVLALPLSRFFSREIELPIRERRKLREILPLELKGETVLETDELVFDGLPLDDGKVLALWGRKRELALLIADAAAAGFEPEVVTAAPLSWGVLLPEEGEVGTAALSDGTALALFRDGAPFFFRPIAGGSAEIGQTLAALELGRGITVPRLWHIGPLAGDAESPPVSPPLLPVAAPLAAAFGGDLAAAGEGAGAWGVAHAVAAGEAVDFRSGELAWTKGREEALKRLRLPLILAALLLLLLVADAVVRYTLVRRDLNSLDASITSLYREIFPGRKKGVDEAAEVRAEIRRLGAGAGGGSPLATLKKLAEAKGDDVAGLYEVEIDGSQVRAKGDARSAQAVTDFRNRLAGAFATAEMGQITSKPDGSVSFTLRTSIKEGGR
ncbi:type II secretion system protein GspL [Geobacter pickeringii]|uniref:General secretion pathway protein GspL n=1 Tax=Geobacter pickeringii TaxID=345632 RepID=A0A0B5B6G3_9BACT|nr:type II secretion system protein GspL [Geobacter pickeringii]AJE02118.1 general secretion pathway protein GspL [Geobacter pickeringii]